MEKTSNSEREFSTFRTEQARTAAQSQHELDAVIEKGITRKFDVHIIPWLFGIW